MKRLFFVLIYLIFVSSAACSPLITRNRGEQQQAPVFRPPALPTPVVSPPVESAVQPAEMESVSRPDTECEDNLTFLNDLTIEDGTTVTAQSTLDKRWEVENSGTCNWDAGYRIRLIAGPEMGAQKEQALFPARSRTRASIRILFQAPAEPGQYRSAWQAYSPQGEAFGDPFFIDITVAAP